MSCRCGHGRGIHKRASGKKRLPCQRLVKAHEHGYRLVRCTCRDYVPAKVSA